ncbi:MAG: hypothetical protein QXN15_04975 [Candidatus Jordarchaeales archaeon]
MDGDFMDAPPYEHLKKDAERNLEVGRFLSAAREFQVLSLMAEKDGAFELAGEFAAKSGDCWLKSGNHATAAAIYEQAAKYFNLSGKASYEKTCLRKAFTEFLLASRTSEISVLDRASFLFRAAKCSSSLGDQDTAKRLLLKACDLSLSSAASSFSNNEYDSAVTHYLFAIKCCTELGDKEKERQVHSLVRESLIRLINSLTVTSSREQFASTQSLIKNWFATLTSNNDSKEHLEQASKLVSECIDAAFKIKNPNIVQMVLNVLLCSDPTLALDILKRPPITISLVSLISSLSAKNQDNFLLSSLLQLLFKELSGTFLINYLPDAVLQHLKKSLKTLLLNQTPEELKLKLSHLSSNLVSDAEEDN